MIRIAWSSGRLLNDGLEFLTRRYLGVAMEPQRGLADALDNSEDLIAFLVAHRFAEDTAKQPYVVTQRRVLVGCLIPLLHHSAVFRARRSEPCCPLREQVCWDSVRFPSV